MKLIGVRETLLAVGLMAAATGISCNHAPGNNSVPAKNAKPGPEESFNVIMDIFRRRMEETPVGFVVSNSSGRSTMVGTNKVSHELIRPANGGEPNKATVTVASQSRYWVNRSKENDDEKEPEKEADAKSDKQAFDTGDGTNGESLDPGQINKPGVESTKTRPTTRLGDRSLPSADEEVRKYELVYKDGRWSLVTELDPKTEQSIQNAFKSALDTQL